MLGTALKRRSWDNNHRSYKKNMEEEIVCNLKRPGDSFWLGHYVSPYAIVSLEDGEKTNEILGCPQKI